MAGNKEGRMKIETMKNGTVAANSSTNHEIMEKSSSQKKKKKDKKRKRDYEDHERQQQKPPHKKKKKKKIKLLRDDHDEDPSSVESNKLSSSKNNNNSAATRNEVLSELSSSSSSSLNFDCKYIVAPMVGASELPFRLLCRKYGADIVYTPMMIASEFVKSEEYRTQNFQTTEFDRPLVCHFAANTPEDFSRAAKLVEPYCDAVDLNLGCPQRTAYAGHFGSYLLDVKDRQLILNMVKAASTAITKPIFVKIRLLDTYEHTLELCRQLYDSGATLIAIHGRYRASYHRKGPGARDGPALLDQIQKLQNDLFSNNKNKNKYLVTNGNTITYDDVVKNLKFTNADGIMSAEGILDNPALYLERFGSRRILTKENKNEDDEIDDAKKIEVKGGKIFKEYAKKEKFINKLKEIETIESKIQNEENYEPTKKERKKLSKKESLTEKKKNHLMLNSTTIDDDDKNNNQNNKNKSTIAASSSSSTSTCVESSSSNSTYVSLQDLFQKSDDKVQLGLEYLILAKQYPTSMRTVVFHIRRILKNELTKYQLMEECLKCQSVDDVDNVLQKVQKYRDDPSSFRYDVVRAKQEKDALERKKREEGKRKEYEARMIRKAKREGKLDDLEYYLRQGSTVPTLETIKELKRLKDDKPMQLKLWKERDHSQHCLAFHLGSAGEGENDDDSACPRGRRCAFLHVVVSSSSSSQTFDESEAVAG